MIRECWHLIATARHTGIPIDAEALAAIVANASPCASFLGYCEARRLSATSAQDAEFWQRLAGSVRKAGTL